MNEIEDFFASSSDEEANRRKALKTLSGNGPPTALASTTSNPSAGNGTCDTVQDAAEDIYEVERIVNRRVRKSRQGKHFVEFFIKWKGYDESHNTWEKGENLLSCAEMLREYEEQHGPIEVIKNSIPEVRTEGIKSPVSIDGDDEESDPADQWEVEALVDRRVKNVRTKGIPFLVEYKIKWKGWPESSNSWEPESSLNCRELLSAYVAEHGPALPASSARRPVQRTRIISLTPGIRARQPKSVSRMRRGSFRSRQEVPLPVLSTPNRVNLVRMADRRRYWSPGMAETPEYSGIELPEQTATNRSLSQTSANTPRLSKSKLNDVLLRNRFLPPFDKDRDQDEDRSEGSNASQPARRCMLRIQGFPEHKKDTSLPAKTLVENRPLPDARQLSLDQQDGEKTVRVFVMEDAEIVRVKQFTIGSGQVGHWSTLQYSIKDLIFPDETIKILGLCKSHSSQEDFFLCIQGLAPDLYFGLSESFLKRRYPKSLRLFMRYNTGGSSCSVPKQDKRSYTQRDSASD